MFNCAYSTGVPGVGCGVKLQHCALLPAVGSSWGRGVPGVVQDDKFNSRARRGSGGETGLAAPAEHQGLDWAVDKKEPVILS